MDALDPATVILDPFLCDALFKGDALSQGQMLPTHLKRADMLARFSSRLRPWYRVSGGGLKKTLVVEGKRVTKDGGKVEWKAPGVSIRTDPRL